MTISSEVANITTILFIRFLPTIISTTMKGDTSEDIFFSKLIFLQANHIFKQV